MPEFNFNPSANQAVKSELNSRKVDVSSTRTEGMYKNTAYFYMTSVRTRGVNNPDNQYLPIFAFIPEGGEVIGKVDRDGYIDSFFNSGDTLKFKPLLKSATIRATGGGDLFDAYISEVDIQFQIFTTDDIDVVEREFFQPGAKVKINFGWMGGFGGRNTSVNNEELLINVYNFGFTMNSDGSYDCKLNGLTEGVLLGNQSMSELTNITLDEQKALGNGASSIVTLPQALLAKSFYSFSLPVGVSPTKPGSNIPTIPFGTLLKHDTVKIPIKFGNKSVTFYAANVPGDVSTDGNIPQQIQTYISFEDLVIAIQEISGDSQFEFKPNEIEIKSPSGLSTPRTMFGSADIRKYIFPGDYSTSDQGKTGTYNFSEVEKLDTNIKNILISVYTIGYFYDKIFSESSNKKSTPKTSDMIRELSNDINRLSGGLVDIQVVPDSTDNKNTDFESKTFKIFNNTEAQKKKHDKIDKYEFSVMGLDSIVKNISISTDFNVDDMLKVTAGNIKKGDFGINPLKNFLSGRVGSTTDAATIQPSTFAVINGFLSKLQTLQQKTSVFIDGINDTKANTLASSFRKILTTSDTDDSTFVTVPYNLKLSLTLDGITGFGFLQPLKVDRLPTQYSKNGVHFVIIGIEHSFDGQGGWETSIEACMKLEK